MGLLLFYLKNEGIHLRQCSRTVFDGVRGLPYPLPFLSPCSLVDMALVTYLPWPWGGGRIWATVLKKEYGPHLGLADVKTAWDLKVVGDELRL